MDSIENQRAKSKYIIEILHGEDNKFRFQGKYMPASNGARAGIWKADTQLLEFDSLEAVLD